MQYNQKGNCVEMELALRCLNAETLHSLVAEAEN